MIAIVSGYSVEVDVHAFEVDEIQAHFCVAHIESSFREGHVFGLIACADRFFCFLVLRIDFEGNAVVYQLEGTASCFCGKGGGEGSFFIRHLVRFRQSHAGGRENEFVSLFIVFHAIGAILAYLCVFHAEDRKRCFNLVPRTVTAAVGHTSGFTMGLKVSWILPVEWKI